jgi:hypothetical protein
MDGSADLAIGALSKLLLNFIVFVEQSYLLFYETDLRDFVHMGSTVARNV